MALCGDGQGNLGRLISHLLETGTADSLWPNFAAKDLAVSWRMNSYGKFSVKSVVNLFFPSVGMANWHHVIWFKGYIPRHSFILWLAIKLRLPTLHRLKECGFVQTEVCFLCGVQDNYLEHLFFSYPFSRRVWTFVGDKCGVPRNLGDGEI